ncbi:hypothetical protein C1H46_033072 [Malus baccata]|uniref:Single-stranded DNA binding protein Ssb-like OB fold domain-containing protein n=1 Tax=Malus baccata TaxID=106549 RepID=A0A540L4F1_MALBA|nr:hypothetical protein C1H46_033072 [Malus baccata]
MAEAKPGLRKPVFTKVAQLRPGTSGHTLTVKVVNTKMVLQKGRADDRQARQTRIAECLVGDETGLIIFTARNDQGMMLTTSAYYNACPCISCFLLVSNGLESWNSKRSPVDDVDLMQEGSTITLRNAKIDMFKGSMRLAVDKWGRVEVAEPASFTVKEDNNLSLVEYELVQVFEQ